MSWLYCHGYFKLHHYHIVDFFNIVFAYPTWLILRNIVKRILSIIIVLLNFVCLAWLLFIFLIQASESEWVEASEEEDEDEDDSEDECNSDSNSEETTDDDDDDDDDDMEVHLLVFLVEKKNTCFVFSR